jgi:Putative MetA-pathway of phenol degradation
MERLILSLLVFLPVTLIAQQTGLRGLNDEPGPAASRLEDPSFSAGSASISLTSSENGTAAYSESVSEGNPSPQTNNSTKAQKTNKSKAPTPDKPARPTYRGSMVGYVDDAIVGSQIRIRFDAGLHDNAPDRADFFYAQYAGLNGPGPNSVVTDLNFQQLYLRGEYAPMQRLSFFTEVPFRWIQPQHAVASVSPTNFLTDEGGISDVAAGFKLAAIASTNRYLTFQFQATFPSGDASSGLGTAHYSIAPSLLYFQRFSDRFTLEAELGDSHPIGGSSCRTPCTSTNVSGPPNQGFAGDVFYYGFGPSYLLYRGEHVQVAPVIELVGWTVLGGLETNCVPGVPNCAVQEAMSADGTDIVNIKAGARAMVGAHSSFYIGYGHQLTHAFWYKEIVRAEYRYSF